jgi:ubiquinone/menaquinone biosynthesis C-methylase UbiE
MYDTIAHYYDLTHADLTADLPLLQQLAQQAKGPLLECGCGTGRVLLPLARAGFQITGLDSSAAMLAIAHDKLAQEAPKIQSHVTLVQGEMAQIQLDGRFALVLIPYNTLLHLSPIQVNQALSNLRQLLQADGRLFIDLANPFALAQTPNDRMLTLEHTFRDPATGYTVLQLAGTWLDDQAQSLHITWVYDATPANGGPIYRTISQFNYHYLYPHQLELQLHHSGFQLEALWGDYDKSPFNEESSRLLVIARA